MALVTLTTDFGMRDSYVAEMKGVLYSEGPAGLRVVDLTHELSPFDVRGAALFARIALPRFPPGSVHVVVVDPGVGTARRPIVVSVRGQLLVGPDNGLFGPLLDGSERVFALTPPAAQPLSSTFHGRDLFAPAAARLAAGVSPASLGTRIEDIVRLQLPVATRRDDALHGEIIHVDRFGNLITNLDTSLLQAFLGGRWVGGLRIELAGQQIEGVVDHYAQGTPGQLLALMGSSGLLEVALREDNAAQRFGLGPGVSVQVRYS